MVEINFKLWIYTVPIHPSSTPKLGFTWIYIFTPIDFNQYSLDVFLQDMKFLQTWTITTRPGSEDTRSCLHREPTDPDGWSEKVPIYSWDIPSGKLT